MAKITRTSLLCVLQSDLQSNVHKRLTRFKVGYCDARWNMLHKRPNMSSINFLSAFASSSPGRKLHIFTRNVDCDSIKYWKDFYLNRISLDTSWIWRNSLNFVNALFVFCLKRVLTLAKNELKSSSKSNVDMLNRTSDRIWKLIERRLLN